MGGCAAAGTSCVAVVAVLALALHGRSRPRWCVTAAPRSLATVRHRRVRRHGARRRALGRAAPDDGRRSTVADGKLSLELLHRRLINETANAENVVLQDAPAGGWTATTEFNIASIDTSGEQAGIVLWRSEGPPAENSFGKIMFIQTTDAGRASSSRSGPSAAASAVPIASSRAPVPALPPTADVLMRVRSDGSLVTAEYSTDDGADLDAGRARPRATRARCASASSRSRARAATAASSRSSASSSNARRPSRRPPRARQRVRVHEHRRARRRRR